MEKEYGLQLWTVHVECEKDLKGMLRKAAELGYSYVEFVDYYDLTAEEMAEELKKNHLRPVSRQMLIPNMVTGMKEAIDYAKTIGLTDISTCVAEVSTPEDLKNTIDTIRPLEEMTTAAGLNFLYHNHGPEFVPVDGVRPIDVLMETFPNMYLEFDTYWAFCAGADIFSFMKEHASRIRNIHIKGWDGEGHSCPFSESKLDVRAIVALARELNIPSVLVEDDRPVPDGLTLATNNIHTLKEWGI